MSKHLSLAAGLFAALSLVPTSPRAGAAPQEAGVRPLEPVGQVPGSEALPRGAQPAEPAEPAEPADGIRPGDLRALLTAYDLDERERAYEDVVAAARADASLRATLEDLTRDPDRGLAWTARLALRELGRPESAPSVPTPGGRPAPRERLDALFGARDPFELLERLQARDPFFGAPFGADPFPGRLAPLVPFGRRGADPDDPDADPFARLRDELRRLEESLRGSGGAPAPGGGATFQGRSEQLSVTPDGVRLEVTEDGPEGRRTRAYEARTLEELYAAHPELRSR